MKLYLLAALAVASNSMAMQNSRMKRDLMDSRGHALKGNGSESSPEGSKNTGDKSGEGKDKTGETGKEKSGGEAKEKTGDSGKEKSGGGDGKGTSDGKGGSPGEAKGGSPGETGKETSPNGTSGQSGAEIVSPIIGWISVIAPLLF
jgi:hypothetical protein